MNDANRELNLDDQIQARTAVEMASRAESSISRLWDRMHGESDIAFRAFCLWRNLEPPRDIPQLLQKLERTGNYTTAVRRWRKKFLWDRRCAAYDSYMEDLAQQSRENAVREQAERTAILRASEWEAMLDRHSRAARALFAKSCKALFAEGTALEFKKAVDALSALKLAVEVETRAHRGLLDLQSNFDPTQRDPNEDTSGPRTTVLDVASSDEYNAHLRSIANLVFAFDRGGDGSAVARPADGGHPQADNG